MVREGGDGGRRGREGERKGGRKKGVRDLYIPCPSRYRNYCLHGDCQYPDNLGPPSCSCHAGFSGPQCDLSRSRVGLRTIQTARSALLHFPSDTPHIQLKSVVYIHLSQIHLNSVFHNS
uniref:EGF-like domain-containing protein n=1 Tax=Hucho hucho TaxID=62062 RepID=A0A4W5PTU7_9TELE